MSLQVTLINRLPLSFRRIWESKFRHNFVDAVNLLCSACSAFFSCCQSNSSLVNELNNRNAINSLNSTDFIRVIIYGAKNSDNIIRYPDNCSPRKIAPPVRVGVWVKVRVSFSVDGQPDNCPRGKLPPG